MRISTGRSWLAVAALALRTAEAAFVTFTDGFNGTWNPSLAIIHMQPSIGCTFRWTTTASVVVDEINLWSWEGEPSNLVWINTGKRTASINPVPSTTRLHSQTPTPGALATGGLGNSGGNEGIGSVDGRSRLRSREQGVSASARGHTLRVESDSSGGTVNIPDMLGIAYSQPLWFEAIWSNGQSYSRLFTVVENAVQGERVPDANRFSDTGPYKVETGTPAGTSSNNDQSPNGSGGQPSGTSGSIGGETINPAANASGGGRGLSSGAVIGIAVACGVVGLILVFALVWFLLRRRQQNKAMHPVDSSYGSGNRTDELMAEKEAGADVDVTPHSPYSDEGASVPGPSGTYQDGAAARGEAVAAGAVAVPHHSNRHHQQQDQTRSFTPYSDDRPSGAAAGTPSVRAASVAQTDEPRVSVPSATPGRATPRALTTPYAHLVEEGMTEEEIRRLEDEERQLDAAIEQAGRR